MDRMEFRILGAIFLLFSAAILVWYFFSFYTDLEVAKRVKADFEKISLALSNFFYSEDYESLDVGMVSLKILVDRYYLKEVDIKDYGLWWLDKDPSDGVIKAAVFYEKRVDPVAIFRVMRDVLWYDPRTKEVYKDYRVWRRATKLVEVKLF